MKFTVKAICLSTSIFQLLAELLLIVALIGNFAVYLEFIPDFPLDLRDFLLKAWLINLIREWVLFSLSFELDLFDGPFQLESWIVEHIPSLSLAKRCFNWCYAISRPIIALYIPISPHYRNLSSLAKTNTERHWAYGVTKDLLRYKFYWWDRTKQYLCLRRISRMVKYDEVPFLLRYHAFDYIERLGITLPFDEIYFIPNDSSDSASAALAGGSASSRENHQIETPVSKTPSGCLGCSYLYGEIIRGELLVCAIHPHGLDPCPDFDPQKEF